MEFANHICLQEDLLVLLSNCNYLRQFTTPSQNNKYFLLHSTNLLENYVTYYDKVITPLSESSLFRQASKP